MSENNGVQAITDKIVREAHSWADEHIARTREEAQAVSQDYAVQAKEIYDNTIEDARKRAKAVEDRAISQGEMDKRKMMLATRQQCVSQAFDGALEKMNALSDEEKVLFMVRNAVKYQTADAEYIFNAADQDVVGPCVVETVNAIFKKEQLKETFSGTVMERLKKLFGAESPFKATISKTVGSFAGGFILKQGDIESNCTFEVLIGGVREELEGEVSSIQFP